MQHRYKVLVASLTLITGVLTSAVAVAGGSANDDHGPRETLTIVEPPSSSPHDLPTSASEPHVADGAAVGVSIVVAPADHAAPR